MIILIDTQNIFDKKNPFLIFKKYPANQDKRKCPQSNKGVLKGTYS